MVKKIVLGVALVGGLVTVTIASLLLQVGAYEPSFEISSTTIDTYNMMVKTGDLTVQMVADPI